MRLDLLHRATVQAIAFRTGEKPSHLVLAVRGKRLIHGARSWSSRAARARSRGLISTGTAACSKPPQRRGQPGKGAGRAGAGLGQPGQTRHTPSGADGGLQQSLPWHWLIKQGHHIAGDCAVFRIAPVHLLAPRPGGLALAALAPGLSGVFLQLVGAIERRNVRRGGKAGADAEAVDRRAIRAQRLQAVSHPARRWQRSDALQPRIVQNGAHGAGMRRQGRHYPAARRRQDALRRQARGQSRDDTRAAPRCRRCRSAMSALAAARGRSARRRGLVVMRLHEGMRHGADERDAELSPA